jgi:hypothetical protein
MGWPRMTKVTRPAAGSPVRAGRLHSKSQPEQGGGPLAGWTTTGQYTVAWTWPLAMRTAPLRPRCSTVTHSGPLTKPLRTRTRASRADGVTPGARSGVPGPSAPHGRPRARAAERGPGMPSTPRTRIWTGAPITKTVTTARRHCQGTLCLPPIDSDGTPRRSHLPTGSAHGYDSGCKLPRTYHRRPHGHGPVPECPISHPGSRQGDPRT